MRIPDLVSPIIAYRGWRWDGITLASFNGEAWPTRRALEATCKFDRYLAPGAIRADAKRRLFLRQYKDSPHEAPDIDCRCGIYAFKSADSLELLSGSGIAGEVHLWGKVVEHQIGWRAQFAYPRKLVLSSWSLVFSRLGFLPKEVDEAKSLLQSLTAYGVDIYLEDDMPFWTAQSGYDPLAIGILRGFLVLPPGPLSPRERGIFALLVQGLSNVEIGLRTGLNQDAVKYHTMRVFQKLGVSNRVELMSLAWSNALPALPRRSPNRPN